MRHQNTAGICLLILHACLSDIRFLDFTLLSINYNKLFIYNLGAVAVGQVMYKTPNNLKLWGF